MAQTSRSDPAIGGAVPTLLTYAEMGNPRRALEDLDRAIELDPQEATARYERGWCSAT